MTEQTTQSLISKNKIDKWIFVIPILVILTVLFHVIIISRPGGLAGVMIYYLGQLVVSFVAFIFLLVAIIGSFKKRPFFSIWRIVGFIGLLFFPISYLYKADQSGFFFDAYPSSHDNEISEIEFRLPLDTAISVAWGGDNTKVNYHVTSPDQRWAYDLMVIENGKSYKGDSTKLENYFCYGLPVIAPSSGKIVKAFDADSNMQIGDFGGIENPLGNHIIIEVAPNIFMFICHLKPNSVKVNKGDTVEAGQELAMVGNSGHTSEPHLHIHMQDTKVFSMGEGIPLYFHHYVVNGKYVDKGIPMGGFDDNGNFTGQIVKNVKQQ